jgi:cytochrome c
MTRIQIKRGIAGVIALGALSASGVASASLELAKAKNCIACHAVDKQVLGPAYREVALRYAGDREALARLTKKVREGGVGVWGQIPMPANPQITEAEAQTLAKWVLNLK